MTYPLTPPLLDLLVLSLISRGDSYGYQISQQLKAVASMKDSTLYPILKRMSDHMYVETYDQPFQGRNRKYYRITQCGQEKRNELLTQWQEHLEALNKIICVDV